MFIFLPLAGAVLVLYLSLKYNWSLSQQIAWYTALIFLGALMYKPTI